MAPATVSLLFDLVLVTVLLALAWRLLATPDILTATVLFIAFGFLMALAWLRLRAPEVALAEAALGAGITGPLFWAAHRRMERLGRGDRRSHRREDEG